MNNQSFKLPITFWITAIVAFIWNIMGILIFWGQTFMSEETMAALPEKEQVLYQAVPSWITVIYAIAVITGTFGCIALLLKKAWAIPVFLVSLICVIIQMGYNVFFTDATEVLGSRALVSSSLIIFIAIYLYYYSRQSKAKAWIN